MKDPLGRVLDENVMDFARKEAEWLDVEMRRYFPGWLRDAASRPADNWKTRGAVALMGAILLVRGIKVERNTHYGLKTGKGFRANSAIQTVDAVSSRIVKRGKVIAEKRFELGFIHHQ